MLWTKFSLVSQLLVGIIEEDDIEICIFTLIKNGTLAFQDNECIYAMLQFHSVNQEPFYQLGSI